MKITLANLASATEQEVFDQVAVHLLNQGARSERKLDGLCLYRGEGGMKCAAGCLIVDEEYREEMECRYWRILIKVCAVPSEHEHLIGELQIIHNSVAVSDWKRELLDFAFNNDLSPYAIESIPEKV